METIYETIDVKADVRTVYNQWTQFEDFPEFMEGIEQVRQLDDRNVHWVASIAGRQEEWDAEIFEQTPDQRIAWRSTSGRRNDGEVTFEKVNENQTRIRLVMVYDTQGAVEKIADAVGILKARVKGDLKRFKEFIENRPEATGAWRGEIHGSQVDLEAGEDVRSKRLRHSMRPQEKAPDQSE